MTLIVFMAVFTPHLSYAAMPSNDWWPLVQCGVTNSPDPTYQKECGFSDVIALIARIVRFLIIFGLSVAAIVFVWAGVLYITAGGNPEQINEAHKIFLKVLVGFILMLSAWLIVKFIQDTIINPEFQDLEEFTGK